MNMAAIFILIIILSSRYFVISETIGTSAEELLINETHSDNGTVNIETVQDTMETKDISGPVIDSENTSKSFVENEIISTENETKPANADDNETVGDKGNTTSDTRNTVAAKGIMVELNNNNNTTRETTYDYGSSFELPLAWADFCDASGIEEYASNFTEPVNLTVIRCNITEEYSGVWELIDLREHLKAYNVSDFKYSVDIECSSWSNVSISWPMKVPNMYSLKVKHCQIMDFLAEFKNDLIQTTPDSLRVLDLSDNRVMVATDLYIDITKNVKEILPEYNCGHDATLEQMSLRNLSYRFLDSVDFVVRQLSELGEQFILDAQRHPVRCNYKHLMYLDEGQSKSMSIYHNELKDAVFDELRVYNLSHSYIKVLKDNQLQWSISFPKLVMYDLSHNHISKLYRFEIPLHTRKTQITTINLQYNKINSFSVEDLERFKEMPTMFIDLRYNPIECNCTENMKQILTYIKQGKYLQISNLTDYSYIKNLTCASPKQLEARTLGSITDLSVLCKVNVEKEYFLVPILVLSCTIVVLSIMLLLLLRYRKEVLIILFTRFNIIVPCQQRHRDDSSKRYDAFVSYSSNDEEWVESVFEGLEQHLIDGSRHFKFCLHQRDFIPGKTIFDNVIRSVESSRHTIILLSNNFLKSEFCLYEFQEAFRQSIMEQKRHLVIVMMEELDPDKLPRDLRRCIQTFTYIRKDDYLFRERLVYALSVKQKQRVVDSKKQKVKYTSSKNGPSSVNKSPSSNCSSQYPNSRPPNPLSNKSKNSQSNLRSKQTKSDNGETRKCTVHINHCNGNVKTPCESAQSKKCSTKTDIKHTDLTQCTNSGKINKVNQNSSKGLALSIENETDYNGEKLEHCDTHDIIEEMDKFDDTDIRKFDDVVSRKTSYDRSISTVSRDTGYFSEKGSPDIYSTDGDEFNKNVFRSSDDIDITDFVV